MLFIGYVFALLLLEQANQHKLEQSIVNSCSLCSYMMFFSSAGIKRRRYYVDMDDPLSKSWWLFVISFQYCIFRFFMTLVVSWRRTEIHCILTLFACSCHPAAHYCGSLHQTCLTNLRSQWAVTINLLLIPRSKVLEQNSRWLLFPCPFQLSHGGFYQLS